MNQEAINPFQLPKFHPIFIFDMSLNMKSVFENNKYCIKTINLIATVHFFSVLLNYLYFFSLAQFWPFLQRFLSCEQKRRFKKYLSRAVGAVGLSILLIAAPSTRGSYVKS